jgi:hypothetical protein
MHSRQWPASLRPGSLHVTFSPNGQHVHSFLFITILLFAPVVSPTINIWLLCYARLAGNRAGGTNGTATEPRSTVGGKKSSPKSVRKDRKAAAGRRTKGAAKGPDSRAGTQYNHGDDVSQWQERKVCSKAGIYAYTVYVVACLHHAVVSASSSFDCGHCNRGCRCWLALFVTFSCHCRCIMARLLSSTEL